MTAITIRFAMVFGSVASGRANAEVDITAYVVAESNESAPATMGEMFDTLARINVINPDLAVRMRKAVGFRNIAVHAYRTFVTLRVPWRDAKSKT